MNKTAAIHIKTFHLYNFFPRKRKLLTALYFLTLCQELFTLGKYCQKKHVEVKVHCRTKGVWYNPCPLIWSSAMTVIIQCRLHCLGYPDPNRAFPELRRHEIPHVFLNFVCSVNAKVTRNFAVTLQNSMTFGATAFPITGDICKLFFMIQHRRLSYIQRRIPVIQNIETKKVSRWKKGHEK